MDHHCPWTNNCIGYNNMPHFFRFISSVVVVVGYLFSYMVSRLFRYYQERDLPSYLFQPKVFALILVEFMLTGFVELTVGILWIRIFNQIIENKTTIEDWEMDRIQDKFYDEDFWAKVRSNYKKFNPDSEDLPELTSWKVNYRVLKKGSQIPNNFSIDDFIFPYDLNSWFDNFRDSMGSVLFWWLPWSKAKGSGMNFTIDKYDEDQLKLPFPPDGDDYDPINDIGEAPVKSVDEDNETVVTNPKWSNYLGETLDDFGVAFEN